MKRHYRVVLLIGFLLIATRDGLPASTADPGQEAAQPADPQTTDQKLQQLQEQVDRLTQKVQAADEKNKSTAKVSADLTGFTIQSSDRNFLLKIGADLQAGQPQNFARGKRIRSSIRSLLRRIRPTFSGTVFQYVDYFFRPDFGMGSTIIYDAYVELKYFSNASNCESANSSRGLGWSGCSRTTTPVSWSADFRLSWSPAATSATSCPATS